MDIPGRASRQTLLPAFLHGGLLPRLAALLLLSVPACLAGSAPSSIGGRDGGTADAAATPRAVATSLGRGINFGNMFEAPQEGDWNAHYDPAYVALVERAGFTHIRLPVRWSNHAAVTADATLDEGFASRIDGVIDLAIQQGLYIVMDMHAYRQLDGDAIDPGEAPVDDAVVDTRFVSIWGQLAARYHTRSNRLVYELYNEPHNRLTPSLWNSLAARALDAVRKSDPDRVVILGPTAWYAPSALGSLALPNDPNLIVTVHDYDPFDFTFQGTDVAGSSAWVGTPCCTSQQEQTLMSSLGAAAAFGAQHGYPVYLGEFGSSTAADEVSRATYTRYARDQAEARSIPWAIWSLIDKGIYDPTAGAWRDDLKNALLGP
jgi:endoglucanase